MKLIKKIYTKMLIGGKDEKGKNYCNEKSKI